MSIGEKPPIYTSFRRGGVCYLAVHKPTGDVSIISYDGGNYGAYRSIASFTEFLSRGEAVRLGGARLVVQHIDEEPGDGAPQLA